MYGRHLLLLVWIPTYNPTQLERVFYHYATQSLNTMTCQVKPFLLPIVFDTFLRFVYSVLFFKIPTKVLSLRLRYLSSRAYFDDSYTRKYNEGLVSKLKIGMLMVVSKRNMLG